MTAATDATVDDQLVALDGFPSFLIALAEAWPTDRFASKPANGRHSLAETICQLREVEVEQSAVYIRKLRWCDHPLHMPKTIAATASIEARPWRIALYEMFQTRLGNVATLRRADTLSLSKTGTFGSKTSFSMRNLVHHMHRQDIASIGNLFELATECGTWPVRFQVSGKPVGT